MSKKKFQPSLSSEATTADVREDEEQAVKFQEIIDLLVAAGYFRARIKGLSNFDKVVGGLTWCIESCNFDVDVDLLFHENLTIGQKISLTEKIVVVLPKMNCPHRIEPHQIQGLDCIHILPVVQWLVIQSMKTREEMAEFVRAYSISQSNKFHTFEHEKSDEGMLQNVKKVQESFTPVRQYKRQGDPPTNLELQLKSTLLEYGGIPAHFKTLTKEEESKSQAGPEGTEKTDEIHHADLMKTMAAIDDKMGRLSANAVGNIVNIQAQEIAKVAESFANIQPSDEKTGSPELKTITTLEKRKLQLQNKLEQIQKGKESLQNEMTETNEKLSKIRLDRKVVEDAFQKMRELETDDNKGMLRRLKELLSVYDGLKEQETKFKEQCKSDLANLQRLLAEVEKNELHKEEQLIAYDEQKDIVCKLKLQLAKKNRQVALMARQLDDVPCRSELTQYQKRFLELYNQVSAKYKETKQHYTLYNTLDDTKLYLNKELSILNSIKDNYKEAMVSSAKKEEFLKQFQEIVDRISENKEKVEKRFEDEKAERDELSKKLSTLKEQQRQYVIAVKNLSQQCRDNELLLSKLRLSQSE